MTMASTRNTQSGLSMLEVLVTIVLLSIGLLGLAGLQSRVQVAEIDAYQRSQSLILLQDMYDRIAANRGNAASYVTGSGSPVGAGMTCPTATATLVQRDLREWCLALQGAAETSGTTYVGAMVGGRGCIENIGTNEYMITVAWQGLRPLTAPPTSVACGANLYDGASGSSCTNDTCRRTVSTAIQIGVLQ